MTSIFYDDAFSVKKSDLSKYDVFNGFVNRDAKYYIAPFELEDCEIDEFKESYTNYKNFFEDIIKILKNAKAPDETDIFFKKVVSKFKLGEVGHIGLGYATNNKSGSGLGNVFARKLADTSYQLIKAGIDDPEIFMLIGLLEEGIGADRISDITVGILLHDFLQYTENVSKKLKLKTSKYVKDRKKYNIPFYNEEPIIFCPQSILTDLPVALDRDDIDIVCAHNEELRDEVNNIIGDTFKGYTVKEQKRKLKELILNNPSLASQLIKEAKDKSTVYDFDEDPNGDFIWKSIADDYIQKFSFSLNKKSDSLNLVVQICNKFKDLIENNDLWKFFHNQDGSHKDEAFAQMLFFALSHSYCEANDLDITPEANSGRGPVDFKLSKGFHDKINIEIKLSTHTRLLHGYKEQLKIYNDAEKTKKSIFLIIQLFEKDSSRIEKVYKYREEEQKTKKDLPEIVVIDATKKKSASTV